MSAWSKGSDGSMRFTHRNVSAIARTDGTWQVNFNAIGGEKRVFASSAMQVKGTDIQDAQRRAQAAAMVLQQLSRN